MGRWALVVALVLVAAIGGTAVAGTAPASPSPGEIVGDAEQAIGLANDQVTASHASATTQEAPGEDTVFERLQGEFERSTFRVRVHASGDAVWTFRYEQPIESASEESAFQTYAERVRTEETDLYRNFRNQSQELVGSAAEATGREMSATEFSRDAGIDETATQTEGYVELTFRWNGFASQDGNQVVVGDVFEGGLYLGDRQTLILIAGEDVRFDEVAPDGATSGSSLRESRSVTWSGERQFGDRRPRAVFKRTDVGGGADQFSLIVVGGGLVGVLVLLAGVLAYVRGVVPFDRRTDEPASANVEPTPSEQPPASGANGAAAGTESTDPELLTDEQRVVTLLEQSGGRMKQTEIVDETDWSKSKVSMLLSDMEETGEIRKIQVGRENIIALAGSEPEAATSPFDDEE